MELFWKWLKIINIDIFYYSLISNLNIARFSPCFTLDNRYIRGKFNKFVELRIFLYNSRYLFSFLSSVNLRLSKFTNFYVCFKCRGRVMGNWILVIKPHCCIKFDNKICLDYNRFHVPSTVTNYSWPYLKRQGFHCTCHTEVDQELFWSHQAK